MAADKVGLRDWINALKALDRTYGSPLTLLKSDGTPSGPVVRVDWAKGLCLCGHSSADHRQLLGTACRGTNKHGCRANCTRYTRARLWDLGLRRYLGVLVRWL